MGYPHRGKTPFEAAVWSKVAEIQSAIAVLRILSCKGPSRVLQYSLPLHPSSLLTDIANEDFLSSVGESRTRTAASHQDTVSYERTAL